MTTTEKNKALLLSENKKALQAVNAFSGIDFNKPYNIELINEHFTARTLGKLTGDNNAVLLLMNNREWDIKHQRRYILKFQASDEIIDHNYYKAGFHDIDRKAGFDYWKYNLDYLWRKADFEAMRKGGLKDCFIIWQSPEYIQPAKPTKYIDYNARYNLVNYDKTSYKGNTYITTIRLQARDGSARIYAYNKSGQIVYPSQQYKSDNINYYVDKSGYIVNKRRDDLRREALKLKAEREAEEARKADFSELERIAEKRLNDSKITISELLIKCDNKDNCYNIYRALYKLWDAFLYLEGYNRRKAEEHFNSVTERANKLKAIINAAEEAVKQATEDPEK